MKEYPYNLSDIMKQFTNTPKRYTQKHFDFVRYAFAAVVNAVEEIHALGYVHRDLKPDNFLGDTECRLYVIQWWLSLLISPLSPNSTKSTHLFQEHSNTSLLKGCLRKEGKVLSEKVMTCGQLASYCLSFSQEKLLLTGNLKKKSLMPFVRAIGTLKKSLP